MYTSLAVWIGIIVGGVAGCLVLWAVLFQLAKVPFKALGGHPGKQLWSVLFMIPVPLILSLVASPANWLLALIIFLASGLTYWLHTAVVRKKQKKLLLR